MAEQLRERGHDVLTALEDGRENQGVPDDQVVKRASALGRAVVTCDRDHYKRIHRATRGRRHGIVVCSQFREVLNMATSVDRAIREFEPLDGRLVNVYRASPPVATP